MQTKLLVIEQPFGLGDCIFSQTIANDYTKDGYKIIWPVLPSLVEGLNRAYPNVVFVDHTKFLIDYENKEFKEIDGMLHLPMRYSEFLMGLPYRFHMKSKYDFLGKDWKRWKDADVVRDYVKEHQLMKEVGVCNGGVYNFIATDFGNKGMRISLDVLNNLKNVELKLIPGYSLFDWCSIIENATNIHAVSSSTLYLFELLNLKASQVHLYPRLPVETNFDFVEFLLTKKYILHL